jgi:hypothetical protein
MDTDDTSSHISARLCLPPTASQPRTTELRDKQIQQQDTHHSAEHHDSRVLPPHLASDIPSTATKGMCLTRHAVGLIDQQLYTLSSRQDGVDVLNHDVLPVEAEKVVD